jgi:hypothetical protein
MLGRITYTGKDLTRKSSVESTLSSKRSNAIHLKELVNLGLSNTPFQDTGHAASMKNTESFIKLHPMSFI